MATFNELKQYLKSIKGTTEATIDGKTYKGAALKAFIISKLSHPESIELDTDPITDSKPKKDKK